MSSASMSVCVLCWGGREEEQRSGVGAAGLRLPVSNAATAATAGGGGDEEPQTTEVVMEMTCTWPLLSATVSATSV